MQSWPPDHWNNADAILLTHYCHHCVQMDEAITAGDINQIVSFGTLVLQYATKLRLTPHARYDPKTAFRSSQRGLENQAGDDPLLGGRAWAH